MLNHDGDTPLHYACLGNGNMVIVRFLIKWHCDPAVGAGWGRTLLHCASESVKLDIVRFLVEGCHCDPFRMTLHYTGQCRERIVLMWSCFSCLKLVNSLNYENEILLACSTTAGVQQVSDTLSTRTRFNNLCAWKPCCQEKYFSQKLRRQSLAL